MKEKKIFNFLVCVVQKFLGVTKIRKYNLFFSELAYLGMSEKLRKKLSISFSKPFWRLEASSYIFTDFGNF